MHYLMRILPYHGGDSSVDGALVTFVDITVPMQAEQQLRLLVHELNHRVRNLLAVVSALARQTAGRSETVEEFVASFIGRVNALARSHGLLAKGRWSDIPLQELVAGEMEPHRRDMRGHIDQSGPPVLLKPKAAVAIGMILHELSVNAVKYGALGSADGRVSITWALEDADAAAHLHTALAGDRWPTGNEPRWRRLRHHADRAPGRAGIGRHSHHRVSARRRARDVGDF